MGDFDMGKEKWNSKTDSSIQQILEQLEEYKKLHPKAKIDAYRQNPVSIRVRIIDPDFKKLDRVDRDTLIWQYLDKLPEDVITDITMLVLVTPSEKSRSGSNLEFEDPVAWPIDF